MDAQVSAQDCYTAQLYLITMFFIWVALLQQNHVYTELHTQEFNE